MLVLTRKPGEKLRIGANITLVVLDVRGKRVRLGVEAPLQIDIAREELYETSRPATPGAKCRA
jgi:carbon storage regulator